jgi:hypothetical protein
MTEVQSKTDAHLIAQEDSSSQKMKQKSTINPIVPEDKNMTSQWQRALNLANLTKRCGAKTRQKRLCQSPAMKNGRCYMHGGKSPGAPKGTKHGRYTHGVHTQESISRRRYVRELIQSAKAIIDQVGF